MGSTDLQAMQKPNEPANRGGHYPYQAPISAYGNCGFRFADMSHRGSILCLPSGMHAWPVAAPAEMTLASFSPVLEVADKIDVFFVGLGRDIVAFDPALRRALRERGVIVEAISTGSAVRTYNVLLAENRAVAAALIAVDEPW
jgi:uncharacterized protein